MPPKNTRLSSAARPRPSSLDTARTGSWNEEEEENIDSAGKPPPSWAALFDIDDIESILQACARDGKSISYSLMLDALGLRFSRPKMRSLCVALGEVDRRAALRGQPELAVLVVRATDGLPGAGWWAVNHDDSYQGPWEGAEAAQYIRAVQDKAFRYWGKKPKA